MSRIIMVATLNGRKIQLAEAYDTAQAHDLANKVSVGSMETSSKVVPIPLSGFELSHSDVAELLPDVTEDEMESIADMIGDYLMESWQECLQHAIDNIKASREDE